MKIKDVVFIILIIISIVIFWSMRSKIDRLTKENITLVNNINAYEKEILGLNDSIISVRGVYEVKLSDLKRSKDSVIINLNEARKQLKIKDNEIKELMHFQSNLKTDTIIEYIRNDSCEFDINIVYNPQTKFHVSSKRIEGKDSLSHSAFIQSSYEMFIYDRKEWKEPNFFKRLFLFRWGKYSFTESVLKSDNDKIQIKNFKVIQIE